MGGGTAVGLNIRGGGALTADVGGATTAPAGEESVCAERPNPTPPRCCSAVICESAVDGVDRGRTWLLSAATSSPTAIVDVWAASDSLGVCALLGEVAGLCEATNPGSTSAVEGIVAGAEVRRLRMPTFPEGSTGFARDADACIPLFLLAFRSSLCRLRNSALSFFEMPSSTRGPVVLLGGAFCAKAITAKKKQGYHEHSGNSRNR